MIYSETISIDGVSLWVEYEYTPADINYEYCDPCTFEILRIDSSISDLIWLRLNYTRKELMQKIEEEILERFIYSW